MRTLLVAAAIAVSVPLAAQAPRPLQPDDIFELKTVADPRISPDGQWVAFTTSQLDRKEDNSDTDIYMVPTAGGARRLRHDERGSAAGREQGVQRGHRERRRAEEDESQRRAARGSARVRRSRRGAGAASSSGR